MRKKILIISGILVLVLLGGTVIQTLKFYPILFQLLVNREIQLKRENSNINILLLGTGGGKHEGPDLTDTIIFASVNPTKNRIVLVSIPRDLWVLDLNEKINTAYVIGDSKRIGGGIILAKSVVAKIVGQPIDYVLRIDFEGFEKAVDLLGGIEVDVPASFDDYEYPIFGKENDLCGHSEDELKALATASSQLEAFPCRYLNIHFDEGLQHLDGKKALEFVRSRHAKGDEGTDFARSKRQEKVIAAFKDKVFRLETVINPVKVIGLYSTLKDSIDTNIKEEEIDDFVRLAQKMSRRAGSSSAGKNADIQSAILDTGDKEKKRPGFLINPPISEEYGNQWVLIPRIGNNNFEEIQKHVECKIKIGNCPITKLNLRKP